MLKEKRGEGMGKSRNLHTIYSWVFIVTTLGLIGIVVSIAGLQSSQNLREESGGALVVTAETMGDQLDQHMWARYGEVEILAQLEPFRNPTNINRTRELINQFKDTFPMFSWIGLTDEAGTVIAATDEILEDASIAERPVYLEAQNAPFIGDVHEAVLLAELLPNPSGEVMQFVDISIPLSTTNPSPVLATHLSWEWAQGVEQQVIAPLEADKGVELFVISGRDQIVLLGPEEWVGKQLSQEMIAISDSSTSWQEVEWPDEGDYVTAVVPTDGYLDYGGLDWTVLARQPVSIAFQPANQLVQTLLLTGVGLALAAGLFGWFFANRLMRPIQELSLAADDLRQGKRTTIPVQKGIAEFESLSLSLNSMVERLRDTRQRLGRMEQLATRDYLTGLPNRRALEAYAKMPFTNERYVFYMDLDGFKSVNDTFGHHGGDELLIQLAERFRLFLHTNEFGARIGGDEFIFVVEADRKTAEYRARELIKELAESYPLENEWAEVGVSAGGRLWTPEDALEDVLPQADSALYEVKMNGKNGLKFSI